MSVSDLVEFPWESRFEFKCRVEKITKYSPVFGVLRATALANVWSNVNFLGCSYPTRVLDEIKEWKPPPKDHKFEEKLAEVQENDQQSMYDVSLVNVHLNIKHLKSDGPFRLHLGTNDNNPICHIVNSSQSSRVPCEFREDRVTNTVSLFINDIHISDGRASNLKDAKRACADNALKFLKKKGVLIANLHIHDDSEVSHVSKDALVGKEGQSAGSHEAHKIGDDNVGCKLLKAMGWTGDTGLGKDGQGRLDPVGTSGQVNRGGLGSRNSEFGICRQNVQERLLAFVRDSDVQKLEFSNELDNLERKLIHRLATKYGLNHKSRGSGANRKLTVWKQEKEKGFAEDLMHFDEEEAAEDIQMVEPSATEQEVVEVDDEGDTFNCASRNFTSLSLDSHVTDHVNSSPVTNTGKRRKYCAASPAARAKKRETPFKPFGIVETVRKREQTNPTDACGTSQGDFNNDRRQNDPNFSYRRTITQPFQDGYVDPYLAHPTRRVGYQNPQSDGYQNASPRQQDMSHIRKDTLHFRQGSQVRGKVQTGNPRDPRLSAASKNNKRDFRTCSTPEKPLDPRTRPSSGFGIYRHMRPQL